MDPEARLLEIESRLARIEARLRIGAPARLTSREAQRPPGATRSAAETPAPARVAPSRIPAAVRPPPSPAALSPAAPATGGDWERFLGVAVLGRVGIGALLLAAAYFAQLAYRDLSAELRVLSIYGLSAALVVAGLLLRPRVAPKYVAILWGGGVAAAYLAGTAARLRYGIVGPVPATFLLVGACALGQVLARAIRLPALAHVALAGAVAAPALVGGPQDARTWLLVYLLVVHAWAGYTESRWGWRGARWIAAVGAAVVGVTWLGRHGGSDLSTLLHVQGYLFGLTWPEWAGVLRGRSFPRRHLLVVLGLAGIGEVLACAPGFARESLRLVPALAGAAWLGLAVLARLALGAPDRGVASLARVGSVVLVVGAMAAWAHMGTSWLSTEQGTTVSLALLGTTFVLLRRFLGAGDGSAALASGLGLLWLFPLASRDPWAWAAMAAPLTLALFGGSAWFRVGGLLLAVAAPFLGVGNTFDPSLRALAFAGAAAAAVLVHARAAGKGDLPLTAAAEGALSFLVLLLAADATTGPLAPVTRAFANPGTTAALALAAALAWVARPGVARPESVPAWVARGALGVLLVFAGWREAQHLVEPISDAGVRTMLQVGYFALTASTAHGIGRALRSERAAAAGHLFLGVAAVLAANGALQPGGGWSAAAQVALVLAPAVLLLRGRDGEPRWVCGVAATFTLAVAGLWTLFLAQGRWSDEVLLANPRFVAGVATTAALVLARKAPAMAGPDPWFRLLDWAAVFLGFGVGLVEVRDVVSPLHSFQWRASLVSVYATLYCASLLAVGFRLGDRHLRGLALLGFCGVVVKVGLHDLSALDTPYRILITGCLGVVLLLAAYAYARRERRAAP